MKSKRMDKKLKRLELSETFWFVVTASEEELAILRKSHEIMKKYYDDKEITLEDKETITQAIKLLFAENRGDTTIDSKDTSILASQKQPDTKKANKVTNESKVIVKKENEIIVKEEVLLTPNREEILEIAEEHEASDIYVDANIPSNKRKNFKKSISYTIDNLILVLIDLTVFGSAKNSIAINEDGIYWHYDGVEAFIDWKEFFELGLKKHKNSENIIYLGDKYHIETTGSNSSIDEIFNLLKELHSLKNQLPSQRDEPEIKPDVDINDVKSKPYEYLELFIEKAFLYASPAFIIALYWDKYSFDDIHENAYDIFQEYVEKLSDKSQLEKSILSAEEDYLALFKNFISIIRKDLTQIIHNDNIGALFTYNEQSIDFLQQEMTKYREIVLSTLTELNESSIELKNHWLEMEKNTISSNIEKFLDNGMNADFIFGHIGAAIAIGATYLSEKKAKAEKGSMEDILLENWGNSYELFYVTQLREYHEAYKALSNKIAKRFITHLKQAHQIATNHNKTSDFDTYILESLEDLSTNKDHIVMRNSLLIFDKLFEEDEQ